MEAEKGNGCGDARGVLQRHWKLTGNQCSESKPYELVESSAGVTLKSTAMMYPSSHSTRLSDVSFHCILRILGMILQT
jgi:hypothetical protein